MSLEKFLANNLALSDAENNTSRPLNRVGSFVLLAYESLAASRNLLQWSLGCMNLTSDSEDLFCWFKQKNYVHELWQQHKQLKTMEISSEAWPDVYNEGYRHQLQAEPNHKIH